MLALGMVLVLVAVLALVSALAGGSDESVSFEIAFVEGQISATGVFLLGALTLLLLVAGLVLVRIGLRRATRHRKNARELERLSGQGSSDVGHSSGTISDPADGAPSDRSARDPE